MGKRAGQGCRARAARGGCAASAAACGQQHWRCGGRLRRAVWAEGRHISSAYEVGRLVTGLMWPQEDIRDRLASPDIPRLLNRDPDLARIMRRSGGTIAPDGGQLTTTGWRRIRRWRDDWVALPSPVIPAVVGPDGILRAGADGLRYLGGLPGHS